MKEQPIGKRIELRRRELGLTLDDIANEIGVARSTVQRYEKDSIEKVKLPVIEAIARVLSVNPAWLCCKSEDMILHDKKEPTPVSESGPISPARQALLDAVKDMDDDTAKAVLEVVMSVKKLRGE